MAKKKAAEATAAVEKKQRKKQPAYKNVSHKGSMGGVADAFSMIEELGNECREIVDNAGDALANTQRIQTFGETADVLENVSAVDVPDCISDVEIHYGESVPTRKGRSTSRSVRCSNIVSILEAAKSRAEELKDENESHREEYENASVEDREGMAEPDYTEEDEGEMGTFIDELENVINEIESLEFPGMYG